MKITVNGEERTVPDGATLTALLEELGVTGDMVATEVNLEIVKRAERVGRRLAAGDKVEIVSFVGGG